jgi:hypothetical protein
MIVKRLLVPIALVLTVGACVGAKPNPSLCELAQNRDAYGGRTVTVDGVLMVSFHGAVIVDPQCGLGIGITWFAEDVPQMREFASAAKRAMGQNMMVRAHVTGVVQKEKRGSLGLPPAWTVRLTKADVLEARPVTDEEHKRFLDWLDGPHKEPFRAAG